MLKRANIYGLLNAYDQFTKTAGYNGSFTQNPWPYTTAYQDWINKARTNPAVFGSNFGVLLRIMNPDGSYSLEDPNYAPREQYVYNVGRDTASNLYNMQLRLAFDAAFLGLKGANSVINNMNSAGIVNNVMQTTRQNVQGLNLPRYIEHGPTNLYASTATTWNGGKMGMTIDALKTRQGMQQLLSGKIPGKVGRARSGLMTYTDSTGHKWILSGTGLRPYTPHELK